MGICLFNLVILLQCCIKAADVSQMRGNLVLIYLSNDVCLSF